LLWLFWRWGSHKVFERGSPPLWLAESIWRKTKGRSQMF
jgi:hypothetical protein